MNKKILFLTLLISISLIKNEKIKAMEDNQLTKLEYDFLTRNSKTEKLNLTGLSISQSKLLEFIMFLVNDEFAKTKLTELNLSFNSGITEIPNQILYFENLKTINITGTYVSLHDVNLQQLISNKVTVIKE